MKQLHIVRSSGFADGRQAFRVKAWPVKVTDFQCALYVILLVGGLGGIAGPAAQGLISRSISDNEQGAVQGTLSGVQTLTGVFGPLIATTLFNYFAPKGIPGASFWPVRC